MSLINDALKRASQVPPTSNLDPKATPLCPAEAGTKRSIWTWVGYAAALMAAAVLASWAMVAGYLAHRELKLVNTQNVVARETRQAPAIPAIPSGESLVESARKAQEAQPERVVVTNVVAQSTSIAHAPVEVLPLPTDTASVAQLEPPKPVAPTFKLQGIFYRPANPTALINSKTVHRGDKVLDAKVLLIQRDSVTLEKDGEKLVLTLPE